MSRFMMIRLIGFLAIFTFHLSPFTFASGIGDAQKSFFGAVSAYKSGDYARAVQLNEEALATGYFSTAVYYNLANAYLKERKPGKAVLNYLRARRMSPRDADLKANLAFARSAVENYQQKESPGVILKMLDLEQVSGNELKWLSFGFVVFLTAFILAGNFLGWRRSRIVLGSVLLGVAWVYFSLAGLMKFMNEVPEAVAIVSSEARFEPLESATVHFTVPEGTEVKVLREQEGWVKVERADVKSGWVPSKDVEKVLAN